jgi:hypothetical protein
MFGNLRTRSQQTTIGASTAETTIVTADAATRNQLVGLHITTLNGAAGTLTLRDATGGSTRAIYDYPNAASVPSTPLIVSFDPPLDQTSTNANWTIQASASATGYKINAFYVKEQ